MLGLLDIIYQVLYIYIYIDVPGVIYSSECILERQAQLEQEVERWKPGVCLYNEEGGILSHRWQASLKNNRWGKKKREGYVRMYQVDDGCSRLNWEDRGRGALRDRKEKISSVSRTGFYWTMVSVGQQGSGSACEVGELKEGPVRSRGGGAMIFLHE